MRGRGSGSATGAKALPRNSGSSCGLRSAARYGCSSARKGLKATELQKLVTLRVQPASPDGTLELDPRTATALADLLVRELSDA